MKKNENEAVTNKMMFQQAYNLAKTPVLIALLVTPIRFLLELSGLPESVIFIIGLLWLTLAFAIYLGIKLFDDKHAYPILLLSLIIFSPISRIPVSIFWWIDTKWEIGTHYGHYFNNFADAVLNHILYGSLVQIIPGFLLGVITIAIMKNRKTVAINTNIPENE